MQNFIIRVDAQNGMSGSRYNRSYVSELVNIDPFTEQGTVRLFPLIEEEPNSPVNEDVYIVSTPQCGVYFFSQESGRIWHRDTGRNWSELNANPNGASTGAAWHFGYLYYFTDTTIGRFEECGQTDRNDNYAIGLAEDSLPNHVEVLRGLLYFTNGSFIGSIDKFGFITNNALDLPTGQSAVTLTSIGDVIRGATIAGDSGADMHISSENSNVDFLVNGIRGDMYIDTGDQMWFRRRIPNQETFTAPYNNTNWRGLPLFGWDHRIYTIGKQEDNDNFVLCRPFTLPFDKSTCEGGVINSMSNVQTNNMAFSFDGFSESYTNHDSLDSGGDTFLVSYRFNGESKIYELQPQKFADEGYIDFPVVHGHHGVAEKMIKNMRVFTDIIPDGTSVELMANVNNEGFTIKQNYPYLHRTSFKSLITESKDSLRKFFEIRKGFRYKGDHSYVQARVVLKSDDFNNNTPVLQSFIELSA